MKHVAQRLISTRYLYEASLVEGDVTRRDRVRWDGVFNQVQQRFAWHMVSCRRYPQRTPEMQVNKCRCDPRPTAARCQRLCICLCVKWDTGSSEPFARSKTLIIYDPAFLPFTWSVHVLQHWTAVCRGAHTHAHAHTRCQFCEIAAIE